MLNNKDIYHWREAKSLKELRDMWDNTDYKTTRYIRHLTLSIISLIMSVLTLIVSVIVFYLTVLQI